jgi:hypothetical protein
MLGAAVELAEKIVRADPLELVATIKAGRLGMGTGWEQELLTAMKAIHVGAVAQVELANAAIEVIAGCSNLANEAALAAIMPSECAQ